MLTMSLMDYVWKIIWTFFIFMCQKSKTCGVCRKWVVRTRQIYWIAEIIHVYYSYSQPTLSFSDRFGMPLAMIVFGIFIIFFDLSYGSFTILSLLIVVNGNECKFENIFSMTFVGNIFQALLDPYPLILYNEICRDIEILCSLLRMLAKLLKDIMHNLKLFFCELGTFSTLVHDTENHIRVEYTNRDGLPAELDTIISNNQSFIESTGLRLSLRDRRPSSTVLNSSGGGFTSRRYTRRSSDRDEIIQSLENNNIAQTNVTAVVESAPTCKRKENPVEDDHEAKFKKMG